MTLVRDKHFSDLDDYLEHLRAKLISNFLDMIHDKHGVNFWVAVYVRYTHPTTDLGDIDIFHSGKHSITRPVGLDKEIDALIDTIRERHISFKRNLSGLVRFEILKTDLQVVEYIPLAGLKFREITNFLAKKQAIINVRNMVNRCF